MSNFKIMLKRIFYLFGLLIVLSVIFNPNRHARYYDYVEPEDIFKELIKPYERSQSNQRNCSYEDAILSSQDFDIEDILNKHTFDEPFNGGEYICNRCSSFFKSAVIVPYRERKEQLDIFLHYMHTFLQLQNVNYRIIIVEQNNKLPFNRAKLLNVGAKVALKLHYPCLILHDVDLLPVNSGNIYACSRKPRHMSSSLDTFRFNLPYPGLVGGIISIQSEQFVKVNGMSNLFEGWGGEDDEFYRRLEHANLRPYRFSPVISRYTMLRHSKQKPSAERYRVLENSENVRQIDGLNSLPDNHSLVLQPLYTLIESS